MKTLKAYVHFGQVESYLCYQKLCQFEGVQIEWYPALASLYRASSKVEGVPQDIVDPLEAYKAKRRQIRDQYVQREFERACEVAGVTSVPDWQPDLAHLALLALADAPEVQAEFVGRVFELTFVDGAPPETEAGLKSLIADVAPELQDSVEHRLQNPGLLESIADEQLNASIFEAPAMILEDELFLGRQHLPLIEWRLGGEQGPPPV